jgi:HSP20 family protein
MANDLIRLMHSLFLPAADAVREALWRPATDVYRTSGGWLVKFDLAGVLPEDVQVSVSGQRLVVRGTRRDWCREDGCKYYLMEISYSYFERSIELPGDLEQAQIATEFRYGLLLVRIHTETDT